MIEIRKSGKFKKWLAGLKDRRARAIILSRLDRLHEGLSGDIKTVGTGVSELRIHIMNRDIGFILRAVGMF